MGQTCQTTFPSDLEAELKLCSPDNQAKVLTIVRQLIKQTRQIEADRMYGQFEIHCESNDGRLGLIAVQPCKFTLK